MRKKKKNSNTPRHKRLNRSGRLQAAKKWLVKYNGNNIVRGYSKHFAVDLLCAVRELELIGYRVEPRYVEQLKISLQYHLNKKREKKDLENQYFEGNYGDECYWFHEEIEEVDEENEVPF